jgi:hypothetical protein
LRTFLITPNAIDLSDSTGPKLASRRSRRALATSVRLPHLSIT